MALGVEVLLLPARGEGLLDVGLEGRSGLYCAMLIGVVEKAEGKRFQSYGGAVFSLSVGLLASSLGEEFFLDALLKIWTCYIRRAVS